MRAAGDGLTEPNIYFLPPGENANESLQVATHRVVRFLVDLKRDSNDEMQRGCALPATA